MKEDTFKMYLYLELVKYQEDLELSDIEIITNEN